MGGLAGADAREVDCVIFWIRFQVRRRVGSLRQTQRESFLSPGSVLRVTTEGLIPVLLTSGELIDRITILEFAARACLRAWCSGKFPQLSHAYPEFRAAGLCTFPGVVDASCKSAPAANGGTGTCAVVLDVKCSPGVTAVPCTPPVFACSCRNATWACTIYSGGLGVLPCLDAGSGD